LAQFVVVATHMQERSGLVAGYDADPWSGHCHIGMAMPREHLENGTGVEAATLFVNYMFTTWNLRKVYAASSAFWFPVLATQLGELLTLEGTLKDHEYYGGRYWDHPIFAIYRDAWYARDPLNSLLDPEDGSHGR
jgi:RimJ/RimL family protein N-acetyltransferase